MASPIPIFAAEGDDAYWWILCIEKYFNVWGTPEVAKLPIAVTALRGPALQWCLCWYQCHPQASWESFITHFLWRFKPEYEIVDDRKQHRNQRRHTKEHLQAELVEDEKVVEEHPAELQETETFVVQAPPSKPVVQLAQTETEAMPSLEEWTSTRSTMGVTVFNNPALKPPPPKPPESDAFTAAKCSSTRKPVAFPRLKPPDVNPTPASPPKSPDLYFQSLSTESQISCEPTRPPPPPKPPDNTFSTRLSPPSFSRPSPPPVNIPPVSPHSQLSQNIHFVTPGTFKSEISSSTNLITIMPKSSNSDEQNFVDVFYLPLPACTVKPTLGFNGFYGYEQFQVNWEPVRPPPPPKPPDRTYSTTVEIKNQLTRYKNHSTKPISEPSDVRHSQDKDQLWEVLLAVTKPRPTPFDQQQIFAKRSQPSTKSTILVLQRDSSSTDSYVSPPDSCVPPKMLAPQINGSVSPSFSHMHTTFAVMAPAAPKTLYQPSDLLPPQFSIPSIK